MEAVKRRSLSVLTALMLVLSLFALAPEGAFRVDAVSGSGTKDDPYIVKTYDELLYGLEADSKELYFKLGADLYSNDSKNQYYLYTGSEDKNCSYYVDLAGHTIKRTASTTTDRVIFCAGPRSVLTIDDSVGGGTVIDDIHTSTGEKDFSYVFQATGGGKLIINGGTYTQSGYHKKMFASYNSPIEIFGGTFSSENELFNLESTGPDVTIYGGKFISTAESSWTGNTWSGFVFKHPSPNFRIYSAELVGTKRDFYVANNSTGYPAVTNRFPTPAAVTVDGEEISRTYLQNNYNVHGRTIKVSCNFATSMSIEATAPKHGKNPETPKTSWTRGLAASEFSWSDYTTGETLSASDTFVGGHKYTLTFLIKPKEGYVIAKAPTVSFWGMSVTAAVGKVSDNLYVARADFECPALIEISTVKILTTKGLPQAGDSPAQIVTSTVGAKIISWEWYDSDDQALTGSSKFEADKTYKLGVILELEEDYKWASSVKATLNNRYSMTAKKLWGRLICSCSYTVPKKVVDTAVFDFSNLKQPEVGDAIPLVNSFNAGVKVISYDWVDSKTLRSIDRSKPFETGKSYLLSMAVTAYDGYTLSDTLTAKIHGSSMKVIRAASEPDKVYLQITYDFTGGVLKGDVDGNGVINMKDLATLQRYVNGWDVTVNEANSDLDNSGGINMKDVAALQRLINSL